MKLQTKDGIMSQATLLSIHAVMVMSRILTPVVRNREGDHLMDML